MILSQTCKLFNDDLHIVTIQRKIADSKLWQADDAEYLDARFLLDSLDNIGNVSQKELGYLSPFKVGKGIAHPHVLQLTPCTYKSAAISSSVLQSVLLLLVVIVQPNCCSRVY